METNKKNNDCYFYYYSTCLKGDGCTFRHEPSALGSETVCSYWAQGKCMNVSCNFRHMELKKNRKTIPCYWESQPNGCQKSHCPFQHKVQREGGATENEESNDCDGVGAVKPLDRPDYRQRRSATGDGGESSEDRNRRLAQDFNTTAIDPVVVNFEEESDNESVPMSSPTKRLAVSRAQTMEEMHLERIQAESAAFYSYDDSLSVSPLRPDANADFRVLSLAEIRSRSATEAVEPGRRAKPSAQIRAERAARDVDLDAEQDAKTKVQGVKRKQVGVALSRKKRAHSPIKFDITDAEPSVTSYKIVNSEILGSYGKSLNDAKVKINSSFLDRKIEDSFTCEVKSTSMDVPATKLYSAKANVRSKPIKLKRPSKQEGLLSPAAVLIEHATNGSSSVYCLPGRAFEATDDLTSSTVENNRSPPRRDDIERKHSSDNNGGLQADGAHVGMAVDNMLGGDKLLNLIQVEGSDNMEVGVGEQNSNTGISLDLSSVTSDVSESELLGISSSSTSDLKLGSSRKDSFIDEEMLLEDTNTEDDILQEDIDALLDD